MLRTHIIGVQRRNKFQHLQERSANKDVLSISYSIEKDCILSSVKGQGLTEYIILLILIALVSIGAAKTLGNTIKEKIQTARRHIHSDINFDNVR